MARVFIFRASKFPRGAASANYIQYLASALISCGNKVIVIGTGRNRAKDQHRDAFIYEEIEYFNNENQSRIEEMICYSRSFLDTVKKRYGISNNDYAISYSPDYFTLKYLSRVFSAGHIAVCRVEHFQPCQYKGGKLNPKYWVFDYGVRYLHKVIKKSIPISSYIQKIDEAAGCDTLLLPIMADTSRVNITNDDKQNDELNFIYAGIKQTDFEDDIELSFSAFNRMSDKELATLNIHITGMNQEQFKSRYCNCGNYDRVIARCTFHGWLDYSELENLYKKMHFLVLARKCNEITMANFPSKIPELMAYGVVPLCTAVGDYTKYYLKNNYNSLIAAENDIDTFYTCLEKAKDLDIQDFTIMSRNARKTVEEKLDYSVWSKKITDFIFK